MAIVEEKAPIQVTKERAPALGVWRNRRRGLVSLVLLGALAAGLVWLTRFDERRIVVQEFIRTENGRPTSDGIYIARMLRSSRAPEFTVIFSRVPLEVDLERSEIRIEAPRRRITIPGGRPLLLVDAEGHIREHDLRRARGHDLLLAALLLRGTSFGALRDLYLAQDPRLRDFWTD